MKAEQTLVILTCRPDLRSEAVGWGMEDSSLYRPDKPIGLTPGPKRYTYPNVLAAQADGWKLIGPPIHASETTTDEGPMWDWWLTRDSDG